MGRWFWFVHRPKRCLVHQLLEAERSVLAVTGVARLAHAVVAVLTLDSTHGWLAPPDGSRGARPTFSIDGVDVLVMESLAA